MDFNRLIVLTICIFLTSCAGIIDILMPKDPNDTIAVPQDIVEQITEYPYNFDWPDIVVCSKTINAYICVTSNTKERFVVSLSDWEKNGWDQEMINVSMEGLSRIIAEVKTLCQQNFKPSLNCNKILEKADFINKLLNKGEEDESSVQN